MSENGGPSAPETGQEGPDGGNGPDSGAGNGFDSTAWQALAEETGLTPTQIKTRLGHARTWEQRAKDNKGAAEQLPTLQQQLDQMQKALADRDVRDVERAGRLAMSQVRAGLADAGIKADDVKELLNEFDPTRLLAEGEPDDEAIARFVSSLSRIAGRPTPDRDQGKTGGEVPADMNALIRRAAGIRPS